MPGHGSPTEQASSVGHIRENETVEMQFFAWSGKRLRALFAVLFFALVLQPNAILGSPLKQGIENDVAPVRVRCQWGGGERRTFVGSLKIDGGKLVDRDVLSLGVDAAVSTMPIGNSVRIKHLQATEFGGADLLIVPDSDLSKATVAVELTSLENPESQVKFTIALDQLMQRPVIEMLDESGNRISISRSVSDQIQVDVGRPNLVFGFGDSWKLRWRPNLVSFKSNKAKGTLEIKKQNSSRRLTRKTVTFERQSNDNGSSSGDDNGSWDWAVADLQIPQEEGVYQVTLAVNPPWYRNEKSTSREKILRRVEFVVLADTAAESDDQAWQLVHRVDLANDFEHEIPDQNLLNEKNRLLPPIPMLAFGPSLESLAKQLEKKQAMGNDRRRLLEHDGETFLQLQVAGWQTIPLQFDQVATPYSIEIDYLSAGPLSLGCSLLEQDRDGQVTADGFDSGVFLPETIVGNLHDGQVSTHRFTVWPSSKKSHLLMVNRHQTQPVAIKTIRVLKAGARLPVANAAEKTRRSEATAVERFAGRQLFAMVENIDFKREYNSQGQQDPETDQALDDWASCYRATDRMIQQLKAGGFDGAYLTVMTDGTSLFPSSLLDPSPQCDSGIFFSDGRDPIRKDILQLVLKMFEREGLQLVPLLAFNSPLPELEKLRSGGVATGLDLVSKSGTRHRFGSNQSLPIYNPLDERVQRAISRIVAEIGERYRGSSALAGIALASRPDTATLLPGSRWGYDAMTLTNFAEQNSRLDIGRPIQANAVASFEAEWLGWRCQKMSDWYDRMGQALAKQSKSAKLYVAPVDLYRNAELASQLAPNLHRTVDFKKLLLQMGLIDRSAENSTGQPATNVVRLIPHRLAFDRSTIQQRSNAAVKNAKQIDSVFRSSGFAGDLFHHRGQWAHFLQLQQLKPFASQKTPLIRMQRLGPGQQFCRQRFIEAIKEQDSRLIIDGGWRSLASDWACQDLLEVFRQLPRQPLDNVSHQTNAEVDSLPIAVRQLKGNGNTVCYIANASPWPAKVKLEMSTGAASQQAAIESFSQAKFIRSAEQANVVEVELPAFGLVGGLAGEASIKSFSFEWTREATADLRKRIFALQLKLQQSLRAPPIDSLSNPDFKSTPSSGSAIDGWEMGDQQETKFTVMQSVDTPDSRQKRIAAKVDSYLRVEGESQSVSWIRSHPLRPTATGRLSISVLLRVPALKKSNASGVSAMPVIRVAVDGRSAKSDYYRYGVVGKGLQQSPAKALASHGWRRFAVHFDDLPDQLSDLRIGFDVVGDGVVHIAKVRLYDRWFDEKDARAITQLLASADIMSLQPTRLDRCRRLLEEYWAVFLNEYFSLQVLPRHANQRVPMFQKKSKLLNR